MRLGAHARGHRRRRGGSQLRRGRCPPSVTTGDFNADGQLDLATANSNSDNVSVLLNACNAQLTALSPAQVWVGLKNSDAVGLRLDLLAEVSLNESRIGAGQLHNVASGSSGFNNARLNAVPLILFIPVEVLSGDVLSLTLSVRRTCFGGGHNSGTPRLWFNDSQADSRFGATIDDEISEFFLLEDFVLDTILGLGPKTIIDVAVNNKAPCPARPYTPFGTWSITLP